MQWADVILTKIGAQVEYAGFARRGVVLIVVHTAPVLTHRSELSRIVEMAGVRLLDLVDNDGRSIAEEAVPADGRLQM